MIGFAIIDPSLSWLKLLISLPLLYLQPIKPILGPHLEPKLPTSISPSPHPYPSPQPPSLQSHPHSHPRKNKAPFLPTTPAPFRLPSLLPPSPTPERIPLKSCSGLKSGIIKRSSKQQHPRQASSPFPSLPPLARNRLLFPFPS